jgi:pimeloyl-ACP methyl ester carboxylesterase
MGFMPFEILGIWVRGLLSLVLLILGPYLLYLWYEDAQVVQYRTMPAPAVAVSQPVSQPAAQGTGTVEQDYGRVFSPRWGFNRQTFLFVFGAGTLLWAIPKGPKLSIRRLMRRPGSDEPRSLHTGQTHRIKRPDGSELHVEMYGPIDGPPVVMTHGWGLDSGEWYYPKKALSGCRLIVWDLPGLGLSKQPDNHDYSLETLARDLDEVLALAEGRPAVLLGHSIGGMITLTHCKLFPQAMGTRVCGLVLVNTTYTNPVRTTSMAKLKLAIQKPVFEPLLHLTIWLSPLVRVMNWLSYLNGSAHSSAEKSGFSGHETRGQLDFVAKYTPRNSPAVTARGMFGMLRYDATATLRTITVPALIITGDKDAVCKPEASERMRADIPTAELVKFSPARHEGLLEHHDQFWGVAVPFVFRCTAALSLPIPQGSVDA